VVRWGGEEFLVLLAGPPPNARARSRSAFCTPCESEACRHGERRNVHLSCSIGWSELSPAEAPGSHATWESIVEHADRALYMAKAAGRDRGARVASRLEGPEERATAAHAHPEASPDRAASAWPDDRPRPDRRASNMTASNRIAQEDEL
jgi:predicted signal transduction protein with EAL and GGDEF domain